MSRTRHKAFIKIAQRVALILALLDVALYFAVVRPLSNMATEEWRNLNAERRRIQATQAKVAQLRKIRETLPTTTEQLGSFVRNHIPERRRGFSRASRMLQRLTEQSGLQITSGPGYRLDSTEGEPFERLGIDIGVVGPFNGLLKFEHALETASDFMLVRAFNFTPVEGGQLQLHMTADLYLTP